MSQTGKSDGEIGRAMVVVEPVTSFGEVMVVDDSLGWVAWHAAIQAWLEAKRRKSGSDHTVRAYQIALRQFEDWAREGLGRPDMLVWPIVSSGMAQEWAAYLVREGKAIRDGRTGKVIRREPLSDASVNLKLSALSSFYHFVKTKYIVPTPDGQGKSLWAANQANPFDAVERPEVRPFENATFLMPKEMERVLGVINTRCLTGIRDFALLYTFMHTCKRFSELIKVKWGDLRALPDGNFAFKYQAKGGKIRDGVLNRKCYMIICAYLRADGRPPEGMGKEDYIFVPLYPDRIRRLPGRGGWKGEANRPLSNKSANRILKKYAKRAGIENLEGAHIHGLRHGGLRLRREEMEADGGGINYGELKELAGHASLEMTFGYSKKLLEDPEDPTGDAAADRLMPKKRRKRKEPPGEQLELL